MASRTAQGGAKYMTYSQAAAEWQMSESTLRRLIAAGKVEVVRFGRLVRIPRHRAAGGPGHEVLRAGKAVQVRG